MANLLAPVKTPLGQDEWSHRSRGLGQRHRTILFLVDGRRSLGEVLAMAHQAGAQTSHFEELVRLGMVEVPSEAAAPEPVETAPGALDTPRLTSVDVEVFADDEPAAPAPPALPPEPPPEPRAAEAPRASQPASVSPPPAAEAVPPAQMPPVPAAAAPSTPARAPVREASAKLADHARPAPTMTDAQRLHYVRELLLDTLRRDSLLFASFSVGRVRAAETQRELIKLVWEIEHERAHERRTRHQILNLQRARELLGMGNTLVAGDSQPGPPSDY